MLFVLCMLCKCMLFVLCMLCKCMLCVCMLCMLYVVCCVCCECVGGIRCTPTHPYSLPLPTHSYTPLQILKEKFEVELIGNIPKSLQALAFVERNNASVTDILSDAVDPNTDPAILPHMPDFLVMGHHGRKGPKEEATMLGSNTDLALR
jgi:hypothetical protein